MNVEEVQRRLWEQSKAHKENREASRPLFPSNPYDDRVRNLSDLIHHPVWLEEAAKRTFRRSKSKAPGIDGVIVSEFREHETENLQQLRLELKKGTYRPQPLKRAEVPKANGTMRQLGLPCLRDKIVQEAIRMMLEPIFEVEFHDNSYGFATDSISSAFTLRKVSVKMGNWFRKSRLRKNRFPKSGFV